MGHPVSQHYDQKLETTQIIKRLREAYPQGPNPFQLAPVDQLHIGGIKASQKLLERITASKGMQILDIGSGLGGLMRLAESDLGLTIVGLDITHGLNRINQQLSALCSDRQSPQLITGDAHHLPFPDDQFDLIIFQHSLLNMPDDKQVLSECYRILKPEGQLLLHEVIQGDNFVEMSYPVPWARDAENSHLITEAQLMNRLDQSGFDISAFSDWSEEALAWRQRQSTKETQAKPTAAPVSPAMVLGPEFQAMGKNVMKNLSNKAARVVEVVATKTN
ncbi:class I SAM-dependent methyltransferase [Neptuniibacter caesariensis]|uniref:Methyltransferase, UbiE/COQ5 family protein n=1 Tax=Neptuniibacter caesariensis TaxID=207954 RepID=A0A7U8C6V2_NEPCE|nr:methyltransferase domain-containing protein [Neptuniibacter caesariensis]EAR62655.1 methyltransferase, UbiE/COQ5 family protein [Oceanospirillum sp. MED92] [Neptuniibacter caesariensis]